MHQLEQVNAPDTDNFHIFFNHFLFKHLHKRLTQDREYYADID